MQIVINISEDDLKSVGNKIFTVGEMFETTQGRVYRAIVKGTPLPKGHGRLIDADELLKEKRCFEDFDGDTFNIIHEETVINASTIIEADKEEGE